MDVSINVDKIYVVHVSSNKLREQHIKNELARFNLPFEFMLKGDKSEISSEIIEEYFIGDEIGGLKPTAEQSCTYKHLSIYEKIFSINKSNLISCYFCLILIYIHYQLCTFFLRFFKL